MRALPLVMLLVAALATALIVGCSTGDPTTPVDESINLALGDVEIAAASGLQRIDFPSSDYAYASFTGFYGKTITRFAQIGRGRICFSTMRHGATDEIYVARPDGFGLTRITNNADHDEFPAWSPDGKSIAFATSRDGGRTIYKMGADGSSPTRLTTTTILDTQPSWSPDGRFIAFQSMRDGDNEIYVMEANGANQTRITTSAGNDLRPAWSPLNNEIAFASARAGNMDIYTVATDGSSPVSLTSTPDDDYEPAWSPSGGRIAFRREIAGVSNIWIMYPDGTSQTQLTFDSRDNRYPEWSPDGDRIMFRKGSQLWVMDSTGTNPRVVSNGTGETDATVSWSGATAHVARSFIGAGASDAGADPPFGAERPLVIVGLSGTGYLEAATITLDKVHWGTVTASGLEGTGIYITGVQIEAARIDAVLEDCGRGATPRNWNTSSGNVTKAIIVFFSANTGEIISVMATTVSATAADATAKPSVRATGDRVIVSGPFQAVWTEPGENAAPNGASEVEMDATTGEVVAVR